MLSLFVLTTVASSYSLHTTASTDSRVAFVAQTPLSWVNVEHNGSQYIRFQDYPLADSAGCPELPVITFLVAIPDSVVPSLEFALYGEREWKVMPVFPAPAQFISYERTPAVADSFVQDSTAYASWEFYPGERVFIGGETRIHDQRLLQVQFHPAVYRAADSTLSTVTALSVSVAFDSTEAIWSDMGLGPFQGMLRGSSIVGYREVDRHLHPVPAYFGEVDPLEGPPRMPDYLILCASGLYEQCNDAIDNLAEHRVALNHFDVALVTTDAIFSSFGGVSPVLTDHILRNFTEHMWENWEQATTKKPTYLLLIGDHEDSSYSEESWFLPTHEYNYSPGQPTPDFDRIGNDEWYAYFNGDRNIHNDFPGMMVGRLSVKNCSEADTLSVLIQNLIALEDPVQQVPIPDYSRRILRLAGTGDDQKDTFAQSYHSWKPDRLWTAEFSQWLGYDYVTHYCGDGRDFTEGDGSLLSSAEWVSLCLEEFGKGAGIAFYSNHGDVHMFSAGLEWWPRELIPDDPHTKGALDSTFNNLRIVEDLEAAPNHSPPFVLLLSCSSGTFNHTEERHRGREVWPEICRFSGCGGCGTPWHPPVEAYDFGTDCLAERLLKHTEVPVAGVFAGSLQSLQGAYQGYGEGILEAVYAYGFSRLGDAVASARLRRLGTSFAGNFIGQFNLLGDPALDIGNRVRFPNTCDLVVYPGDIEVSRYPVRTSTGAELPLSFIVRNAGAVASGGFGTRVTFSVGESSSSVVFACSGLGAGEEQEVRYTWTCAPWFSTPAALTVTVEADYLDACNDCWRQNNTAEVTVQLNDIYPFKEGWPVRVDGVVGTTPLLVNLDADPALEVVVLAGTALQVFSSDGSEIWSLFDEEFKGFHPLAADLDTDGEVEILLSSTSGIKVVSPDGEVIGLLETTGSVFVVGDMHQASGLEVCVATGHRITLHTWDSAEGTFSPLGSYDVPFPGNGTWSSFSLVCADLSGNPYQEVIYYCGRANATFPGPVDPLRAIVAYNWNSEAAIYSESWEESSWEVFPAAGTLAGVKMIGFPLKEYNPAENEYPALLIEPGGMVEEHPCEPGTVAAGNLVYGVFADWDPLVSGLDAFILPSEMEGLAWFNTGYPLDDWPTLPFSGSSYASLISPTALGDLDDSGLADVLFCTKLDGIYQVMAFNHEGDNLAGFHIALPDDVSALGGFAVGDIDRDGTIEIVFGTSDGLLHCWELGPCTAGYTPWPQFQQNEGRTGTLE